MLQFMGSQRVGNISAIELNSVKKLLNGYSPDIERILKIMRWEEFGFLADQEAADQQATVRTGHGKMNWFKTGKGISKGSILSPRLFNLYVEYIIKFWTGWSTSWNQDCQRNINNFKYEDDATLRAESKDELKILLMKVNEESEKVGFKLQTSNSKN